VAFFNGIWAVFWPFLCKKTPKNAFLTLKIRFYMNFRLKLPFLAIFFFEITTDNFKFFYRENPELTEKYSKNTENGDKNAIKTRQNRENASKMSENGPKMNFSRLFSAFLPGKNGIFGSDPSEISENFWDFAEVCYFFYIFCYRFFDFFDFFYSFV
jgi:hypothetical protein